MTPNNKKIKNLNNKVSYNQKQNLDDNPHKHHLFKWVFLSILVIILASPFVLVRFLIAGTFIYDLIKNTLWLPTSLLIWILFMIVFHFIFKIINKKLNITRLEFLRKSMWTIVCLLVLPMILIITVYNWPVVNADLLFAEPVNSQMFSALSEIGVQNSNTIIEEETIKVIYQLPENFEMQLVEMYILGIVSTIAPYKEDIIIITYSGEEKRNEINVNMDNILAYKRKEISISDFTQSFKQL